MPGKRALVVDDSKSARVVLSRMLEKYGIEVDSADSAESALDYLRTHHPDVIFMDHLMPGMDGLQAVREIKANPELATIPIMMYTSQEGELYGGQARASGAVGVLPKSIRPIDVTKALYQLQMLPERRDALPSALQPVDGQPPAGESARAQAASADPRTRAIVEAMLKEQHQELRRFILATLDTHTHRIVAELRPRESAQADDEGEQAQESKPAPAWPWKAATIASLLALAVVAVLYWQAQTTGAQAERAFEAVTASNEALTQAVEKWRIASERLAAAGGDDDGSRPMVLSVPFGEPPLAPARIEAVRALVAQLERAAIAGLIRVETFAGSFCLSSAGGQGYSLAAPGVAASQCEQFGNPFDDTRGGASRQPLAFANLAASVKRRTGGAVEIELVPGPRDRVAVAYPAIDQATAGQWNAAAQSNNRVEIRVIQK